MNAHNAKRRDLIQKIHCIKEDKYLTLDESLFAAIGANADEVEKNNATTTATLENIVDILGSCSTKLFCLECSSK